jgi:hypothetical protein
MTTQVKAAMTNGRTVSGELGTMIRLTAAGLLERQSSSGAEEVWHLYPWHLAKDPIEFRSTDIDETIGKLWLV